MIVFKKIRWMNFLSTGNVWTEVDLNRTKSTLIVGDNGAGKSTILDALCFALYGKPFRKINKGQLMNSINRKKLCVELEFQIGSSQYRIIRGIKPNTFEVYQNGTMLNQDAAVRDYQESLEKQILKLNHKSFCQVVVLGSATFTPFMQLPATHRREVIEDLLDIQIFSTMNALLKDKQQSNKDDLTHAEYQYDLTEEKIKLQNKHTDDLVANAQKVIEDKKISILQTQQSIDKIKDNIKTISAEIVQLNDSVEDKQSTEKKINKINSLESQLEDKIRKIKKEIQFFTDYDNCPTCSQEIDHSFKCDTVDKRNKQLSETQGALEQLEAEYERVNTRLNEILTVVTRITNLNTQVSSDNATMTVLSSNIDNLRSEINNLQSQQTTLQVDNEQLKTLEDELKSLCTNREKLVDDKEVLNVASTLLKDGGIKTRIIKQYVPIINKLINKYLAAMDFFVSFELDENFNETIKSRFRDDFSYASFSEGEKMRIDLSLLFAWRAIAKIKNSVSTNLLILDEVFDSSLDGGGTDEFLKILNNLTSDVNVFIISHKGDQLYDKFHSVIKFEKHKNFSRMAA
jgi:DNA repair exonuclease SbcCD ATPase subunit